ncbi:MAG: AAA family ATPase [Nitrospinae bacterium]|nr:AAA family ATPase [Nitrospinota bacterium]
MEDKELEYIKYFGLHYNPFPVAPDSQNFFLSDHIDQILTDLVHGIVVKKGFMILTGEIGLGKTTISRRIMNILEEKGVETSLILLSLYQDVELIREINRDFGIESDKLDLSAHIRLLNDFLMEKHRENRTCALIIDDAQNLTYESLELIRMISNLETDHEKLIQILLIGQPELNDKLNDQRLRQLKSRIVIREEVQPITHDELKNYILFKLSLAGNTGKTVIANSAFGKIYGYSKGNFRAVNILMDRCLYVAFLCNSGKIDNGTVREAYKDLGWDEGSKRKKLWPWLIGLLALSTIVLGYSSGLLNRFGLSPVKNEVILPKEDIEENQTPPPEVEKEEPVEAKVPEAVTSFLSGYGLAEFALPLYEAMKSGSYVNVSDSIFTKSGNRLIILDNVPNHIRSRYGILSLSYTDDPRERFLLFWKPTIQISKFYLDYQGEEIGLLQRKLASIGLYEPPFDNNVGNRLMRGLNTYQQDIGIEPTGFPGEKTLFFLSNE